MGKFRKSEGLNTLGNSKGGKVKLLTGNNSVGKKLTLIFQREFTWYYKKEHLKNSSVNLILLIKYCRYFRCSNIYERPLPDATCFDLCEKCRLKWAILACLIFQIITWYFIDSYFIFGSKKKIWLIAFLTNLWYSSMTYMMETWQPSIINRDVENLFVSASDHRIILWNLSFRVYLHVY